jgi:S-adenosylmethionine/arginine decarboxylase-like enzyme
MDTRGDLLTMDVWLPRPAPCVALEALIERALRDWTILHRARHAFCPEGLTAIWLLGESHCGLHTYPEADFFAVDLYSCSRAHPVQGFASAVLGGLPFSPQKKVIKIFPRGVYGPP